MKNPEQSPSMKWTGRLVVLEVAEYLVQPGAVVEAEGECHDNVPEDDGSCAMHGALQETGYRRPVSLYRGRWPGHYLRRPAAPLKPAYEMLSSVMSLHEFQTSCQIK